MAHSALRASLDALTASFIDAVMDAIRTASLQELLREAPRVRQGDAPRIGESERATSPVGQRKRAAVPAPAGRTASARSRRSGVSTAPTRSVPTPPPPAPAAEITDPQGLLAMGLPLRLGATEAEIGGAPEGPASTVRAIGGGSPVRLRANETLARVSNAGVVIRRGK
jgi:hypothetical protein